MLEAFRIGIIGRGGTLFDGFDAAFREGEVWAVTGPACCGKSRLLAALHGDAIPDAGDVMFDKASLFRGEPDAVSGFRQVSGAVPERYAAGPHTVGELFRMSALAAGGVPGAEREAREAALLSMVGLSGFSGFPFETLSASERFRAALAIELFRGPRVLYLDAPLSRAGREWFEMLGSLFRALAREGRTIVFAEREIPPAFPMKATGEPTRSGPFLLTLLASGIPAEGAR